MLKFDWLRKDVHFWISDWFEAKWGSQLGRENGSQLLHVGYEYKSITKFINLKPAKLDCNPRVD